MKKTIEELVELKKKFANNETLMKLQLEKLGNVEQEVINVKEENKKLKILLKQVITGLDEARDRDIDLPEVNLKSIVEEFKKNPKLQEYLNSYRMGVFNMAYEDMRRYLQAKQPSVDKSFIDVVQNALLEGKELDHTLASVQSISNTNAFTVPS